MRKSVLIFGIGLALFSIACEPTNNEEVDGTEPPTEIENIEIPDPDFKDALVNTNSVDTNNDGIGDRPADLNDDGEINITEAEAVPALILYFEFPTTNTFIDLTGIEYFKNITNLELTGTYIYEVEPNYDENLSYDFTTLEDLRTLKINQMGTNHFAEIDLSGLENLEKVNLDNNRPTNFEEEFRRPENYIVLNLEGTSSLKELSLTNSFLKIDFCEVPGLEKLNLFYLEGGEPEVFDLHCLTNLKWLDISENWIHSIILKNGSVLDYFRADDIGSASEYVNYPFPEYICLDDIPEEFTQLHTLIGDETEVSVDCSFE